MKKLICGLAAVALFGLSAEAVTIDPGVGVAVSPEKISGNTDVDVFSGIVTMDPLNDYVGTTRITNGTLIASKLAPAGTASSIGSSGFVDVGNAIFRYTGTEAVTMDRVFTNTVSILASTGTVEVLDLQGDVTFTKRFTTGYMPFAKTGPGAMIIKGGGYVMPLQSGNGYGIKSALITPNVRAEFPANGTSPTKGVTPPFTLLDGSLIFKGGTFTVPQTGGRIVIGGWTADNGEEEKDVFVTLDGGNFTSSTGPYLGQLHGFANYNTPNGPSKVCVTVNNGTWTQGGGKSFVVGSYTAAPTVKVNGVDTPLTFNTDLRFTVNAGGTYNHGQSWAGILVHQRPGQKATITADGGLIHSYRIVIGEGAAANDSTGTADFDIKNGGHFECESFTNNVSNKANPPACNVRVTSGGRFDCDTMVNRGSGTLNFYLDGCTVGNFGLNNGKFLLSRKTVLCAEVSSAQLGTNAVTLVSKGNKSNQPFVAIFAKPFTTSPDLAAAGRTDGGVIVTGETPENTVEFAAAMAYTGPTVIASGILAFSGSGAIPAATDLMMDGGTLLLDGNRTMTVASATFGSGAPALALGPGALLEVTGDAAFNGKVGLKFVDASGVEIGTAVTHHAVLTVRDEYAAAVRAARFIASNGSLTITALSLESNGNGTSTLYADAVPASVLSFVSDFSESTISVDSGYTLCCSNPNIADGTHTVVTFAKTGDETYIGRIAAFALEWKETELAEAATETAGEWAITVTVTSNGSPTGEWIPVGLGGSWSAAANWTGAVPDGIGMTAYFPEASAAGVPVVVDGDVTLGAVRFQAGATVGGYRLSGNGSLTLDSSVSGTTMRGVEISAVDGAAAHVHAIATPVTTARKQNWAVPEGQTLVLEKGVTAPELTISSGAATVGGTTVLGGTNVIDGRLVLSNGLVLINGKVTSSTGRDEAAATSGGATVAYVRFANNTTAAYLTMSNAVIEKPTYMHVEMNGDPRSWWHIARASTNVFAAHLNYTYKSGNVNFDGPGARLEIVGGGQTSYSLTGAGSTQDTEVYIGGKPFAFTCYKVGKGQTLILDVPGTSFSSKTSDPIGLLMNGTDAKVDFRVSDAMSGILNGNGQVGSVFEFNATTQRLDAVRSAHNSTFHGTYPATCEIVEGYPAADAWKSAFAIRCQVTGGLGFTMSGPDVICLSNRVFESHGDIKVTNGVMEFAHNASWLNGTNVTVAGTGTLKLNSPTTFNREFAVIRFADDGKIELPSGMTQVFAEGWDGDTQLRPGTVYTSANLPAHVAPGGAIRIAGGGLTIIFR